MSPPTLRHDLSPVLDSVHHLTDCLRYIVTFCPNPSLKPRVLTSLDGAIWVDCFS